MKLDELAFGAARLEASDQVQDAGMAHPQWLRRSSSGYGDTKGWDRTESPGRAGEIPRPGYMKLRFYSATGASMPLGLVGSMRTPGPIVDESTSDLM